MSAKITIRIRISPEEGSFIHNFPATVVDDESPYPKKVSWKSDDEEVNHLHGVLTKVRKKKTVAFRARRGDHAAKAANELLVQLAEQDINEEGRLNFLQVVVEGGSGAKFWIWLREIQILKLEINATEIVGKFWGAGDPSSNLDHSKK